MSLPKKGLKVMELPKIFKYEENDNFQLAYDLTKIFRGVQRHLWLVLIAMVLFASFASFLTYKSLYTYSTTSYLLYQKEDKLPGDMGGVAFLPQIQYTTVMEVVKLGKNLEAVKTTLGLDIDLKTLNKMIQVPFSSNKSELLHISVRGKNPNLIVDIANALAKITVKNNKEFTQKHLVKAIENFEEKLDSLRQLLAYQIQEIENFKRSNQYFDMDPTHVTFLTQVEHSRTEYDKANIHQKSLLIEYENLKRETESLPDYIPINFESRQNPLQTRIMNLETALAGAMSKYTEDNPKVIRLEEELEKLYLHKQRSATGESKSNHVEKNTFKDKLNIELMHMQGKVRSTQMIKEMASNKVALLEKQLEKIPSRQMAFMKLIQKQYFTEQNLQNLLKTKDFLQLKKEVPEGNIVIYQLALEAKPLNDAWWVYILPIIGIFIGFLSGCLGALLIEVFDPKLRTAKQVENIYNVPCIKSIPEIKQLTKANAEKKLSYYIRKVVDFLDKEVARKDVAKPIIISLLGTHKGEGKSLFAYCLAKYYHQLGEKTQLIDFDSQHNEFLGNAEFGLDNFLAGQANLNQVIQPNNPDHIKLQRRVESLKEMFKTKKLDSFWEELKAKYSYIIIEAPGLADEEYANNLAEISDINILVVNSDKISKYKIDETLLELSRANIVPDGLLLNRVHPVYNEEKKT